MVPVRDQLIRLAARLLAVMALVSAGALAADNAPAPLKIGMIGLDTSHCLEFTKLLNADSPDPQLAGCRIVAVYPKGSPDIESSVSRVPDYTVKIKEMGVEVIDDLPAMLQRVDAVLLELHVPAADEVLLGVGVEGFAKGLPEQFVDEGGEGEVDAEVLVTGNCGVVDGVRGGDDRGELSLRHTEEVGLGEHGAPQEKV